MRLGVYELAIFDIYATAYRRRLLEMTVGGEISIPSLPLLSPCLPSLPCLSSLLLQPLPPPPLQSLLSFPCHLFLICPLLSLCLPIACPYYYPLNPATGPRGVLQAPLQVRPEPDRQTLLVHFQAEISAFSLS